MLRSFSILLGAITLSLLPACDSQSDHPISTPPKESKIFTSTYPLAFFAQRISGNPDLVYFPKIDGDPAFWSPDPTSISKIQQCNPLFLNGAGYEKWLGTVTLPESRITATSISFQNQFIEITSEITHQHGPEGDHSHQGTAFTTWIDFSQAVQQAQSIGKALIVTNPERSADLENNLKSLTDELQALDQDLKKLTSSKPKLPLVASHPIYQYFARAYDLEISPMLWEPDVFPDEKQWQSLEQVIARHPAKWMVWESQPLEKSVQRLKTMGIGSVVFDPCSNTPATGDFLSIMKQNIENLRPVFSP